MNFDFFQPIPESIIDINFKPKQIGYQLKLSSQNDFNDAEVVFIGIINNKHSNACDSIRRSLYQYYVGKQFPAVYDLGNLLIDEDFSWRKETFYKIIQECIERNMVLCFLGGGQEFLYEIQYGYASAKKYTNIGAIQSSFQVEDDEEEETTEKNYLFRLFAMQPSYLFNFVHMGHQNYLVDPNSTKLLNEMNFEEMRLGALRDNLQLAEPLIRDLDILSISTQSIKQAETNGQPSCSPNGLYSEELAQLCRYAGRSEKLSSIVFSDYNALYDTNGACAQLLAQSIWCFIEGYAHQQKEYPHLASNSFTKYTVHNNDMEVDLLFIKSEKSGRWWIEMPQKLALLKQQFFIPCLYEDYETALEGDIPERWLKGFQKLSEAK